MAATNSSDACLLGPMDWQFHHDAGSLATTRINRGGSTQRIGAIENALEPVSKESDFVGIEPNAPVLNLDVDARLILRKSHQNATALAMATGIGEALLHNTKNCRGQRLWELIKLAIATEFDFYPAIDAAFGNKTFHSFNDAVIVDVKGWKPTKHSSQLDGCPVQKLNGRIEFREVDGNLSNADSTPEGFEHGCSRRNILAGAVMQLTTYPLDLMLQLR
jgi:hypothetical protein